MVASSGSTYRSSRATLSTLAATPKAVTKSLLTSKSLHQLSPGAASVKVDLVCERHDQRVRSAIVFAHYNILQLRKEVLAVLSSAGVSGAQVLR